MFGSQLTTNLDFFWCEQRSVTGANWSHLLHCNGRQVRHDFDLRNVLQREGKMNATAPFKIKPEAVACSAFMR